MSNLIISGASDDLIEINGLITDEFNVYRPATVTIKVDDAVHLIATAEYDDHSEWRVAVAGNFPDATVSWTKAPGEDGPDQRIDGYRIPGYSDVLIVHLPNVDARRIDVACVETSR